MTTSTETSGASPYRFGDALPSDPLPPWPGAVRNVGGRDVFVRTAGTPAGEPAVFVHGLGGASTNWTDLMALLGDELDGSALDLPGFGFSAPTRSGKYPLRVHAATVIALIESLGRGPVHLFGNSLGGATSTLVAARRPDLVKTLTLVSPALPDLRPRPGLDLRLPLIFLPGIGPLVQRRLAGQPVDVRVSGLFSLVFDDPRRVPAKRRAEAAEELMRRDQLAYADKAFLGSLRGLVAAQLARGDGGLWASARRVAAPTLLVWGRHDKLVDVRVSERASRSFPSNTLVIFEDAGHVAMLEQPEATAAAWRARFGRENATSG